MHSYIYLLAVLCKLHCCLMTKVMYYNYVLDVTRHFFTIFDISV